MTNNVVQFPRGVSETPPFVLDAMNHCVGAQARHLVRGFWVDLPTFDGLQEAQVLSRQGLYEEYGVTPNARSEAELWLVLIYLDGSATVYEVDNSGTKLLSKGEVVAYGHL